MIQKKLQKKLCILLLTLMLISTFGQLGVLGAETASETVSKNIMINQIGYYPESTKVAVFSSVPKNSAFSVRRADTGKTVFSGTLATKLEVSVGDFSDLRTPGEYYIVAEEKGWRSANFRIADNVLDDVAIDAFKMFYYARCGCKLVDDQLGHEACHTKAVFVDANNQVINQEVDVTGGWHDAGDYGRYILTATVITYDFLMAYQAGPDFWGRDDLGIPESGNGMPDILDELRYELEWMLKMQDPESGGVHAQVSGRGFPYPVVRPDEEAENNSLLYVYPVTTAATAAYAAAMAYASDFYREWDASFADRMLNSAKAAYAFLKAHPDPINDYIGNNHSQYVVTDDTPLRYTAMLTLACVTQEQQYSDDFRAWIQTHGIFNDLSFSNQSAYANLQYILQDESRTDPELRSKILAEMVKSANSMATGTVQSPYYYSPTGYPWGSNTVALRNGAFMALVGVETKNDTLLVRGAQQLDFTFGCNAVSTCFMTGHGTFYPHRAHHAPALATQDETKVKAGMIVNGPYETADGYEDDWWNHYCNEVSLYTNSAFLLDFTVGRENRTETKVPTGAIPGIPKPRPSQTTEETTEAPTQTQEKPPKTTSEATKEAPTPSAAGCQSSAQSVAGCMIPVIAATLICRKKQKYFSRRKRL